MRALRSPRYTALLDRLVDASQAPALTSGGEAPIELALPPLLRDAWERLARRARAIKRGDPDERYHAVRILAKRARYAAEAIGPVLPDGGKRERPFAAAAAALQDLLGSLQDAVIGSDLIRQHATSSGDPRFNLAAGRLYERAQQVRQTARAGYPDKWRRLARQGERLSVT